MEKKKELPSDEQLIYDSYWQPARYWVWIHQSKSIEDYYHFSGRQSEFKKEFFYGNRPKE